MSLRFAVLTALLAAPPAALVAGPPSLAPLPPAAAADARGTYLGLLFSPIPDARANQLPASMRHAGVLVTQVLPGSPAAAAGVQRDDIVVLYDTQIVRDADHFARLIQNDKPDRRVRLTVVRGSKAVNAEALLTLGPKLHLADAGKSATASDLKAIDKPGAPGYVTVAATPLGEGRMKLSVEYVPTGQDRSRVVTCEGKDDAIDRFVTGLPDRERDAVRKAVARLRMLNPLPENGPPRGQ